MDMPDQENAEMGERSLIRSRCRWLERNSDLTNAILSAMVRNVVNTGIRPQARCASEAVNARIEALWNEWIRPENCDVSGQMGFYEIQRMIVQRKTVDGEILVKLTVDAGADFPLKLQLIRPDLLDDGLLTAPKTGRVVRGGIELDDRPARRRTGSSGNPPTDGKPQAPSAFPPETSCTCGRRSIPTRSGAFPTSRRWPSASKTWTNTSRQKTWRPSWRRATPSSS